MRDGEPPARGPVSTGVQWTDDEAVEDGGENGRQRRNRELIELLNELRVALPGVQVLFAFLLTVPFSGRFAELTQMQEVAYFATFIGTVADRMSSEGTMWQKFRARRRASKEEEAAKREEVDV